MQQLHVLEADNHEMKGLFNENKEAFKDALVTNEQLRLRVTDIIFFLDSLDLQGGAQPDDDLKLQLSLYLTTGLHHAPILA